MTIDQMLIGAIAVLNLVIMMYFLKFWKDTKDVFFILFAASFLIECVNRALYGLNADPFESNVEYYLVRMLAYLCIFAAIMLKNIAKN